MKKYIQFIQKVRHRNNSNDNYIEFQQFQADWLLSDLSKRIKFSDKIVLDLGSGNGGYSTCLAVKCKTVYSLDLNLSTKIDKENIICIKGDATKLPFENNSFDFVFCSSLIEHMPHQSKVIHEINRILRSNQFCYLSYPPFFSPVGGHQFKPFHLLGEKNAIKISKFFKHTNVESFDACAGNWGLYPTSIRRIKNLVKMEGFEVVKISTRFLPMNFATIPFLCEFLTWHVEFLLQKRED